MTIKEFANLMFNMGVLFAVTLKSREPVRSAQMETLFRIQEEIIQSFEKERGETGHSSTDHR